MKKIFLKQFKLSLGILLLIGINSCNWMSALFSVTPSRVDTVKVLEEKMRNDQNSLVFMDTSEGSMIFEIYIDCAPKTSINFIDLALGKKSFFDPVAKKDVKRPYFDDLIFHRVIPNFMIQGGDILGNGTGGPGYQFEDEISAVALGLDKLKVGEVPSYSAEAQTLAMEELNIGSGPDDFEKKKLTFSKKLSQLQEITVEEFLKKRGYQFNNELKSVKMEKFTLAMANSGPNTNGSQFFINLVDNPHLNGKHTVFGKLLKGRKVLTNIIKIPINKDKPTKDVIIKKVALLE